MIFAAIAAVTIPSSCNKEQAEQFEEVEETKDGLVRMTFNVRMEGDAFSKAVLNSDGRTVSWDGTEKIAVIDDINNDIHEFDANVSGDNTSFSGYVNTDASEFVAVYPYSAIAEYNSEDSDGRPIYAEVPNIQEAVLGSFDPSAALYVAQSSSRDAKFEFKAAFALLKVNVDRDNVVAIIAENTRNNFAGSIKMNVSPSVSNGTGTVYKNITLRKSDGSVLEKGIYYMVVRYLGSSSVYENFKLSYLTDSAVYGQRTASESISDELLCRKAVLNLGSLTDVSEIGKSYYYSYLSGFDVKIGSHTINRKVDGDPILLTSANGSTTAINKSNLESGCIYFLKAVGTGNFKNANNPTITNKTYLISDTDDEVDVAMENVFNLADNGELYMKGLHMTMTGGKTSFFSINKNTSKSMKIFVMDGCRIEQSMANMISTSSSYKEYGVENIELVNNRFAIGVAANLVNITSSYTGISEYKSIRFVNNYVYSTTGINLPSTVFNYTGNTGDEMEAVVNNNIFYNVVNGGNFKHNTLKSAEANYNVFWAVDGTDPGANAKLWSMKTKAVIGSVSVDHNIAYGTLAEGRSWTIADSTTNTGMGSLQVESTNPLALVDVDNGTFIMASGYEKYGPQF